jgi:hypothetical protein
MNRRAFTLLLGMTFLLLASSGCEAVIGSGSIVTKVGDVGDFTGLHISNAFNVHITKSNQCRVEVKTNENLMPYVVLENQGGILRIAFQRGVNISHATSEAYIQMPFVREVHFTGATSGELIGDWSMPTMDVDMSGASKLNGRVIVENLNAHLSGASNISLQGSGNRIDLSGSGASHFDLRDFAGNDATIDMSGASHAALTVNGNLNAKLSGASSLKYRGEPKLGLIHTSGASTVQRD